MRISTTYCSSVRLLFRFGCRQEFGRMSKIFYLLQNSPMNIQRRFAAIYLLEYYKEIISYACRFRRLLFFFFQNNLLNLRTHDILDNDNNLIISSSFTFINSIHNQLLHLHLLNTKTHKQ